VRKEYTSKLDRKKSNSGVFYNVFAIEENVLIYKFKKEK